MTGVDYLLIGHLTADLTADGRRLGGTVSYAARTASAFGLKVAVLTSAVSGEPLLAELLPYAEINLLPAEQTSTFENIYEPGGRKQFIRGVASRISADDIPRGWLSAPLVHLAPIADEIAPSTAHLFSESLVMLTLQGWLRRWDGDGKVRFKRWHDPSVLADIDMVVFSEEDILEAPELEQDFARTTRHLFVTRAEKGGTYYHQGSPIPYSTPQVQAIHPTGAGDVFAASLLAAFYLLDSDMRAAVQVAAKLAANSVTRFGLNGTPTPQEVQSVLSELKYNSPHR